MDTDRQKENELTESGPGKLAVGGWISFEVANVVFWMGIVGMVFPLWAADDITVGYTLAATMAVVLFASPIIGALSDQSGRRKPYLMGAAAICVVATMFVGEVSLVSSLALFALAFTSMELATILYNSLLVDVSNSGNRGAIAGLGVGVGYLGAFIAVGCALIFSEEKGYLFVFKALAIIYFLFALPIFLFLKENNGRKAMRPKTIGNPFALAFAQIIGVVTSLKRYPGLRPYLTARFFYMLGNKHRHGFCSPLRHRDHRTGRKKNSNHYDCRHLGGRSERPYLGMDGRQVRIVPSACAFHAGVAGASFHSGRDSVAGTSRLVMVAYRLHDRNGTGWNIYSGQACDDRVRSP